MIHEPDPVHLGVGGRAERDDHIAQADVRRDRAAAADADHGLHAVLAHQLGGVDGARRNAHAVRHHRHAPALVEAGVPVDVAHFGDAAGVREELARDVLGAQRIAGHEHRVGEVAGLRTDMRRRHGGGW